MPIKILPLSILAVLLVFAQVCFAQSLRGNGKPGIAYSVESLIFTALYQAWENANQLRLEWPSEDTAAEAIELIEDDEEEECTHKGSETEYLSEESEDQLIKIISTLAQTMDDGTIPLPIANAINTHLAGGLLTQDDVEQVITALIGLSEIDDLDYFYMPINLSRAIGDILTKTEVATHRGNELTKILLEIIKNKMRLESKEAASLAMNNILNNSALDSYTKNRLKAILRKLTNYPHGYIRGAANQALGFGWIERRFN